MEKIKLFFCFVIGRTVNGYLHQQSFVLHHNMSNRKQHKYPTSFAFFKILTPFVSISFTSFVNSKCLLRFLEIIVQGLKQMINSIHHLQI